MRASSSSSRRSWANVIPPESVLGVRGRSGAIGGDSNGAPSSICRDARRRRTSFDSGEVPLKRENHSSKPFVRRLGLPCSSFWSTFHALA